MIKLKTPASGAGTPKAGDDTTGTDPYNTSKARALYHLSLDLYTPLQREECGKDRIWQEKVNIISGLTGCTKQSARSMESVLLSVERVAEKSIGKFWNLPEYRRVADYS